MWWFKRAVLHVTYPEAQLMHPWFLDYSLLEPRIRELVRALNQTDLVETLSSCEGHPESPLCRVTRPTRWKRVLPRLQELAQGWLDVELVLEGTREQWLGFRVWSGQPDSARAALDRAIGQTTTLIKGYLSQEVVAMSGPVVRRKAKPVETPHRQLPLP
jgi:hypothetical protein